MAIGAMAIKNGAKVIQRAFSGSAKLGGKEYKIATGHNRDSAKVFDTDKVSDNKLDTEVKDYFRNIGGKEPTKFKIGGQDAYKIETPNGNFTLRRHSTSTLPDGNKPRWTIDVPNKLTGVRGESGTSEIKFK
jgi:hypothetical protein